MKDLRCEFKHEALTKALVYVATAQGKLEAILSCWGMTGIKQDAVPTLIEAAVTDLKAAVNYLHSYRFVRKEQE